jgi:hypothetical protein
LVWKLPVHGEASRSFGISVAGPQGRIAYAFETEAGGKKDRAILLCMPNSAPRIFRWQDSAGEPTSVNWWGLDYAVVGTTLGVVWFGFEDEDSKNFAPLAMAQVPNGKGMHETTEIAHWYLLPNPKNPMQSLLRGLESPILGLVDFQEAAAKKRPLETLKLDEAGLWR